MPVGTPYRPRVSRETRLLFTAGLLAIAALWILARIRFPDRPVTPNPVPAVLEQLARTQPYDDLAREVVEVHARLQPWLMSYAAHWPAGAAQPPAPLTALRVRDDLAVAVVPQAASPHPAPVVAIDEASGVAVVRDSDASAVPPLAVWAPRQVPQLGYVLATTVGPRRVGLRPVFVGALEEVDSPLWSAPVWAVPRPTDLAPGVFLFTSEGELIGLVVDDDGRLVIVPGGTVLTEFERLAASAPRPSGTLGLQVQAMTPAIASLTGAARGVVVTWVERSGPAVDALSVGDVIEAVDGRSIATLREWNIAMARLAAEQTVRLRVRGAADGRDIALRAGARIAPATNPSPGRGLGLALRTRAGIGAEVVRVDSGAAGDRAGLLPGDVITLVGSVAAPTPAQLTRRYAALAPGEAVLVAATRGDSHLVTAIER